MKVLVTGGAGFIGAAVVKLLSKSCDVVVLDDLSASDGSRLDGVPHKFVHGSILDENMLSKAMSGCFAVVHMAALISVEESFEQPDMYSLVNETGFAKVLRMAADMKCGRVVYASSAAVYGDSWSAPSSEIDRCSPTNPYGSNKRSNEVLAGVMSRRVSSIGLRIHNVYGPGQNTSGYAAVVPKFISLAMAGEPLTIHGSGNQIRDFVHVDDVAEAFAVNVRSEWQGVVNVGTGIGVSVNDLAVMVSMHSGVRTVSVPAVDGDVMASVADVSSIARLTGWRASKSLSNYIKAAMEAS